MKNCRTRIRIQKFWNSSGFGVWKSDSSHLCWRPHSRAPIAVFFLPDLLFFSPSGWLGLVLKNPIKSEFFEDKTLATTYSNCNSKVNIYSGHCSVHMRCDHQVKKVLCLTRWNKTSSVGFTPVSNNQYHCLILTVGCLPSSTDSDAVARTSEVKAGLHRTWTNAKGSINKCERFTFAWVVVIPDASWRIWRTGRRRQYHQCRVAPPA